MALKYTPKDLSLRKKKINPRKKYEESVDEVVGKIYEDLTSISSQSLSIKISLTAAELQNAWEPGGVPIDSGIESPGIGKAIWVTGVAAKLNYGSIPFNFSKGILLLIVHGGAAGDVQWTSANFLNGTTDSFLLGQRQLFTLGNQIVENVGLNIWTQTQATQGDSTCDLYIEYKIFTL